MGNNETINLSVTEGKNSDPSPKTTVECGADLTKDQVERLMVILSEIRNGSMNRSEFEQLIKTACLNTPLPERIKSSKMEIVFTHSDSMSSDSLSVKITRIELS